MAEIKSTLDLVMERTKHLSLSEEEKDAQKTEESKKAIRGILQRYLDQSLTKEEMLESLNRLSDTSEIDRNPLVIEDIAGRVTLTGNNRPLFELLSSEYGMDVSAMESAVKGYRDAARALMKQKKETARDKLSADHRISGTAVLPNLEADPSWAEDGQRLGEQFGRKLAETRSAFIRGSNA